MSTSHEQPDWHLSEMDCPAKQRPPHRRRRGVQRSFDPGVLSIRWRLAGTANWAGENGGTDNHAQTDNLLSASPAPQGYSRPWTRS